MRAGPSGSRELRSATPPSARDATSTQLPSALLCRLFTQRTPSELARIPFRTDGTALSLFTFHHGVQVGRPLERTEPVWPAPATTRAISREIARRALSGWIIARESTSPLPHRT